MDAVDVVAVVGSCAPERFQYAKRLADSSSRMLVPASRIALAGDPIDEAAALVPWANGPAGAVVEFPSTTSVVEVIGALADAEQATRLVGMVCVADATHLLSDLRCDDYVARRVPGTPQVEHTARALLSIMQFEYASTIVLVNWAGLETSALSTLMALVSHLGPHARLRLHRGSEEPLETAITYAAYTAGQERPGWVGMLNTDFDPHMTDPRVSALRYEHIRPLHPSRLQRLLDDRIEQGEFGTVIRSAGFCRLATRSSVTARWEHVGQMISFAPLTIDDAAGAEPLGGEELLALGQDLAFIGLDLDRTALRAALDETVLTDAEFDAGPRAWESLLDPFPKWQTVDQRLE